MGCPRHVDRIAFRKAGSVEGWQWCRMERIGEGPSASLIVEGGVPARVYASGPRKGRPDWRGVPTSRVIVAGAEIGAERRDFESRTGLCGRCEGDGKNFAAWSKAEGATYRPCRECFGTGKAARRREDATPAPDPS